MDVERQIRNALEARFEKLAPTELKNISVAMDLFRIVLPWEHKAEIRSAEGRTRRGEDRRSEVRKSSVVLAGSKLLWIAFLGLLLLGIGWWWTTVSRKSSSARLEGGAPATPNTSGLA